MRVCLTNSAIERFRSLTKEMNHTKNWWRRHKSICRNGGGPHLPGLDKHYDLDIFQKANKCVH